MKSRCLSILLVLCMVMTLLPTGAFAAETTSGTCGDDLSWTLEGGTLTVAGNGAMYDFPSQSGVGSNAPWTSLADQITTVVIKDGVTSIGGDAFNFCKSLFKIF